MNPPYALTEVRGTLCSQVLKELLPILMCIFHSQLIDLDPRNLYY